MGWLEEIMLGSGVASPAAPGKAVSAQVSNMGILSYLLLSTLLY